MDLKYIDKKYRPVPFWSWNEKLDTTESAHQVKIMDEAGIGGFFMHARGGLQTEYMGEEWFDNVGICIDEAEKRGMHAWAYDENGWPSGFGNGVVNGKGLKYQQKYLRYRKIESEVPSEGDNIICTYGNYCLYYDVNPFYVDTLDCEVIADFINEIYEPYYEKYGTRFDGFFTDEPQISRCGIPWSFILPEEYKKAYGYDLLPHLIELFIAEGDYIKTRMRFWKLVTELFSKNFMKQIHDWCDSHGLKFTGHLVLEESFDAQLTSNGACMPHYEYFDIPGMDWLGRPIFQCLTMAQLSSAAAQTGRKQILSETFACCGHNVGHDELKRNYEWMMVRGVNLMCQHLEGYSLRGIRKRDYPPAMYCQQPWWADYNMFNDAMSRVGMLIAEGSIKCDTLVIHNITSGWICFDCGSNSSMNDYNDKLINIMNELEAKHIPYHLGDEILMERHGRVCGNELVIGNMRYKKIIVPPHIAFFENTEKLLAEFKSNGGEIVEVSDIAPNNIVDNPNITYTLREFPEDGFTMHYFVNSTENEQKAKFTCGGKIMDITTGELYGFDGTYTFPKWGSLVIIDDGTPAVPHIEADAAPTLDLLGEWNVANATENSITLDKCTYWFDGELQDENGYVLNIAMRALELKRPVQIRQQFKVNAEYVPERMYIAVETPRIFEISVNGKPVDTENDCGFFRDHSFRKLDISGLMQAGENIIETNVSFTQSDKVYENMEKALKFESEKNKLTFDTEIEAMYLVGNFGVRCDGIFDEIPHNAAFFDGKFVMTAPPEKITLQHIERQGYAFFSGELTVEKEFIFDKDDTAHTLKLEKLGINAIRVAVNGKPIKTLMWTPFELDLTPHLEAGKNTITLTLVNNLRNLLGPHHHTDGELLSLGPWCFYNEPCIMNYYMKDYYTERYSFVETTIK